MEAQARRQDVVATRVDDELVVYDSPRGAAHSLDPVCALVWEACDGRTRVEDIAARLRTEIDPGAGTADVEAALAQLSAAHLLEEPAPATQSRLSRRQALRRLGAVGGAAALAPAVVSIALPSAARAQSVQLCTGPGFGQPCSTSTPCCPPFTCANAVCGFNIACQSTSGGPCLPGFQDCCDGNGTCTQGAGFSFTCVVGGGGCAAAGQACGPVGGTCCPGLTCQFHPTSTGFTCG